MVSVKWPVIIIHILFTASGCVSTHSNYRINVISSFVGPPIQTSKLTNRISVKSLNKNLLWSENAIKNFQAIPNLVKNINFNNAFNKFETLLQSKFFNLDLPFQKIVYSLTLSFYLLDRFIFDGLFAGVFELRGNAVAKNNEWHRLITSLFIHRDWHHLAMNMLSFSSIAPIIYNVVGSTNSLIIYFGSGIIANYVTYVYHVLYSNGIPLDGEYNSDKLFIYSPEQAKKRSQLIRTFKNLSFLNYLFLHLRNLFFRIIFPISKTRHYDTTNFPHSFTSRGASGSIYGLHGAYAVLRWNKENILSIPTGFFLPNRIWEIILSSALSYIGENNTDSVAHIAGFIGGMLIGLLMK